MPSVITSIQNLFSAIFEGIGAVINGIFAVFQSILTTVASVFQWILNTIFSIFNTILAMIGNAVSGVADVFGGLIKFLLSEFSPLFPVSAVGGGEADWIVGNIVVIGVIVAAVVLYGVYAQKNGQVKINKKTN